MFGFRMSATLLVKPGASSATSEGVASATAAIKGSEPELFLGEEILQHIGFDQFFPAGMADPQPYSPVIRADRADNGKEITVAFAGQSVSTRPTTTASGKPS